MSCSNCNADTSPGLTKFFRPDNYRCNACGKNFCTSCSKGVIGTKCPHCRSTNVRNTGTRHV